MEKYCISVDWLQVCCYSNNLAYLLNNDYYNKIDSLPYWLELQPLETRNFARFIRVHTKVGNDWRYCADILAVPRSTMLNSNIVLVKIHNRFLYSQNYIKLLYNICDTFKLSIKGLTRLDLCYDCNSFHGGLKPHKFIKEFVTAEFDSPRYIYKVGAKQFRVYGGKSVSSATKFSGIEFGSGKSSKRCYIYDKTRELEEVKNKPWIRQYWQENGLISDEKTHVYRAEISIKCDGMDLLNMSTGELFKLSPEYLRSQPAIEKLFHFYAARMFRFHRKGKHTRVRDYDRIELFENSPVITCKPKKVCVNADTGRTEKICVSTLSKLSCQYSDLSQEYSSALSRCITFLSEVAGIKYAKEKLAKEIQGIGAFKGVQFKEQSYIEYFALVEALGKVRYSYAYQNPDKDILEDITCSPADDSLGLYYQYLEWCNNQE
jgi:hypothetical protein